jgi:hypothetical protein
MYGEQTAAKRSIKILVIDSMKAVLDRAVALALPLAAAHNPVPNQSVGRLIGLKGQRVARLKRTVAAATAQALGVNASRLRVVLKILLPNPAAAAGLKVACAVWYAPGPQEGAPCVVSRNCAAAKLCKVLQAQLVAAVAAAAPPPRRTFPLGLCAPNRMNEVMHLNGHLHATDKERARAGRARADLNRCRALRIYRVRTPLVEPSRQPCNALEQPKAVGPLRLDLWPLRGPELPEAAAEATSPSAKTAQRHAHKLQHAALKAAKQALKKVKAEKQPNLHRRCRPCQAAMVNL